MSLELPKFLRRIAMGGVGVGALLLLSGCSQEEVDTWKRVAMPAPRSAEAHDILHLWQNAWIVCMIVGVIVWGLMFYASIRFRRRSEDEVPVQTRYNLPIEVFYTLAPVVMVIVFFFFTVQTQDNSDHNWGDKGQDADVSITVVGQQWSWTFDYNTKYNYDFDPETAQLGTGPKDAYVPATAGDGLNAAKFKGTQVYDIGTSAKRPTLWLPEGAKVQFYLYSPDVVHSFWSVDFLFKKDVVPGRNNTFGLVPNVLGTFEGRCAELCGVYHSRMLFDVNVVSPEEFNKHLEELAAQGQTGAPLGSTANQHVPGLEAETTGGTK